MPTLTMISDGAKRLNLNISAYTAGRYDLVAMFTTQDGEWDISDKPYSVPLWARRYLTGFSSAGAATHAFARVESADGVPIAAPIRYWCDGVMDIVTTDSKPELWANHAINGSYNPANEHGPWSMQPIDGCVTLSGIGLPYNHHVSLFTIWREVAAQPVPEPSKPLIGFGCVRLTDIDEQVRALDAQITALQSVRREIAGWLGK